MSEDRQTEGPVERGPSYGFWYDFLNMFPFLFIPLVAIVGILLAIVMPVLTGAYRR